MDGTSIWAGDRVHLASNATRVAAMKRCSTSQTGGGGVSGEPVSKQRGPQRGGRGGQGIRGGHSVYRGAGPTTSRGCPGAAPRTATSAAGVAGDNPIVKAKIVETKSPKQYSSVTK